jgi:hypothetical protein
MAYLPFPSGTLLTFAGSTAPDGWLLCDGSAVSRTTYARLFAAISTTYGNGDGALTFNIPDLRGVYPRGAGTNSTANYGGVTGHTPAAGALATKGGQKTAKNGLTASSAAGTVNALTGTTSINHSHGSSSLTLNNTNLSHTHTYAGSDTAGVPASFWLPGHDFGTQTSNTTSGASATMDHGHSGTAAGQILSGTNNAAFTLSSGTTTAQTITVGAGDTETTPAFLAVNYIIKL